MTQGDNCTIASGPKGFPLSFSQADYRSRAASVLLAGEWVPERDRSTVIDLATAMGSSAIEAADLAARWVAGVEAELAKDDLPLFPSNSFPPDLSPIEDRELRAHAAALMFTNADWRSELAAQLNRLAEAGLIAGLTSDWLFRRVVGIAHFQAELTHAAEPASGGSPCH